jgi:hypothetical protein
MSRDVIVLSDSSDSDVVEIVRPKPRGMIELAVLPENTGEPFARSILRPPPAPEPDDDDDDGFRYGSPAFPHISRGDIELMNNQQIEDTIHNTHPDLHYHSKLAKQLPKWQADELAYRGDKNSADGRARKNYRAVATQARRSERSIEIARQLEHRLDMLDREKEKRRSRKLPPLPNVVTYALGNDGRYTITRGLNM